MSQIENTSSVPTDYHQSTPQNSKENNESNSIEEAVKGIENLPQNLQNSSNPPQNLSNSADTTNSIFTIPGSTSNTMSLDNNDNNNTDHHYHNDNNNENLNVNDHYHNINDNHNINDAQNDQNEEDNQDYNEGNDQDEDEDDYDPEAYRCDVCRLLDATDDNPIVICDSCNIPVHKECYGAPLTIKIPDDEWICDKCDMNSKNEPCALCPQPLGIMKRTTDWRWAHLSCAQWVPECYFRNQDGCMDPIDLFQIPTFRFQASCMHCNIIQGATMQCSQPGCSNFFHITCGMKHNIYLSYQQSKKGAGVIVALCSTHTSASEKAKRK